MASCTIRHLVCICWCGAAPHVTLLVWGCTTRPCWHGAAPHVTVCVSVGVELHHTSLCVLVWSCTTRHCVCLCWCGAAPHATLFFPVDPSGLHVSAMFAVATRCTLNTSFPTTDTPSTRQHFSSPPPPPPHSSRGGLVVKACGLESRIKPSFQNWFFIFILLVLVLLLFLLLRSQLHLWGSPFKVRFFFFLFLRPFVIQ